MHRAIVSVHVITQKHRRVLFSGVFIWAGCCYLSLSSHLQMKYATTSATTETIKVIVSFTNYTSFPLPDWSAAAGKYYHNPKKM